MVNIDVIVPPRNIQGRQVTTHQHCHVHWRAKRSMLISQVAGFEAEVGHICGLLENLHQFQVQGNMTVEVTSEGRSTMEGTYETYFPEAMQGLYGALETIDAFCLKLKELAPGSSFTVTYEVTQTCEITKVS